MYVASSDAIERVTWAILAHVNMYYCLAAWDIIKGIYKADETGHGLLWNMTGHLIFVRATCPPWMDPDSH